MRNETVRLSSKGFSIAKYLGLVVNTYIVGVSFVSSDFNIIHKMIAGVLFSGLLINTVLMTMYMQWRMKNEWADTYTIEDDL
jgi:hypothetical protein